MQSTHDRGVILVTGATGTVGRDVVPALVAAGATVRAASLTGSSTAAGVEAVRFGLTDPATWPAALAGVDRMFLLRPPAVSNVRRDVVPFLEAARAAGVRHVVLLSVQGAGRLPVTPHARIEAWLRGSGMDWTFVRPSFFAQNLTGVHAPDVTAGRLVLPAGRGRTAFVDSRDVAAVVAAALLDPDRHRNTAWTPTGPQALTYDEVCAALSDVLHRPVAYERASLAAYARHAHDVLGMDWSMVAVTAAIYTTARLGLAGGLTDDVRTVTGRAPASLREVAERERAAWPAPAAATPAVAR